MKTALLVAAIVALVAAAAWALARPEPAATPFTTEVGDVAGVQSLVVTPEVLVTITRQSMMPEVAVRANVMPEVVVHAPAAEIAGVPALNFEAVN
jgi:hypothetical protein